MIYGLQKETIDKIKSVLEAFPRVEECIIYGSRAKGDYRYNSDIDLTLKGENLDFHTLSNIAVTLDDLLLPYMIDLSIYDQIENSDLKEHIKRIGKLFYKKRDEKSCLNIKTKS